MAKRVFLLSLLCLLFTKGMAFEPGNQYGSPVNFVMVNGGGILNPGNGNPSVPRTPALGPKASINDHTLYLYNVGYDLTLVLLDEDGEAVYTAYVPAGTSAVNLPATLCGDFEIQLYPDGSSYYFYGWVEL